MEGSLVPMWLLIYNENQASSDRMPDVCRSIVNGHIESKFLVYILLRQNIEKLIVGSYLFLGVYFARSESGVNISGTTPGRGIPPPMDTTVYN